MGVGHYIYHLAFSNIISMETIATHGLHHFLSGGGRNNSQTEGFGHLGLKGKFA